MSVEEISYHKAMDMMEEFRLIMKRFHKKSDAPYRRPEFQAMLFLFSILNFKVSKFYYF